ncbi:hypothetical protein BC941DRAFT_424432 [Chlamydoabsidia padenii]|nr:hypothetical protein BC941DRAFT_424432 [Chlamydoabsidia padenii]
MINQYNVIFPSHRLSFLSMRSYTDTTDIFFHSILMFYLVSKRDHPHLSNLKV